MDEAGGQLNAERRGAPQLEIKDDRVVVGGAADNSADLLTSYAAALATARRTTPNKVVGFRLDDLETLALILGCDGHDVEGRIRSLLDCTQDQARQIHAELRRKRLLRPAAALAIGTAIIWGPAAAAQDDRPSFGPSPTSSSPLTMTTVAVERGDGPQMTEETLPTEFPSESLPTGTTPPAVVPASTSPEKVVTETSGVVSATVAPDVGIPAGETPTEIFEAP